MNEKQQIFEIIDGFKNLTSKIKKDNDEIKDSMKNKDLTNNLHLLKIVGFEQLPS